MFSVTLINLTADGRATTEGGAPLELGSLSADETAALLDVFAELDPVQNMHADPEIRIQTRRDRFIVRTGQKKLFLYDARRLSEPAYVLTAREIIAELDGTAAAKRTAPPVSMPSMSDGGASSPGGPVGRDDGTPLPFPESRPWPFGLIGLVAVLGGYIAYSELSSPPGGGSQPSLAALPQSERLTEDAALTGVYMTGSEPGQHGIVILGDGKLKLFVVNAQAAPGVVYGTYQFGKLDSKLCLSTDQPGGLIKVIDREALEFGGETYKRIP